MAVYTCDAKLIRTQHPTIVILPVGRFNLKWCLTLTWSSNIVYAIIPLCFFKGIFCEGPFVGASALRPWHHVIIYHK